MILSNGIFYFLFNRFFLIKSIGNALGVTFTNLDDAKVKLKGL